MVTFILEDERRLQFRDEETVWCVRCRGRTRELMWVKADVVIAGDWLLVPGNVKKQDRDIDLGQIVSVSRTASLP